MRDEVIPEIERVMRMRARLAQEEPEMDSLLEKFKHCSTQVNLSPGEQSMVVDAGQAVDPRQRLGWQGA